MGISLLWLRGLRLVSGKLGNVELKETRPHMLSHPRAVEHKQSALPIYRRKEKCETEVRLGSCLWTSVVGSAPDPLFSAFSRAGLLTQMDRQTNDLWRATESRLVS